MSGTAASTLGPDLLVLAIRSENWKDYEAALFQYLSDKDSPTEETDRWIAKVTETIDWELATAEGIGDQFFDWRTKNARIILSSYTPRSTQLLARLASNLSLATASIRRQVTLPDTETRLTDARLILRSLKVVSEIIEAEFDPNDPHNQPLAPVPVPGGNYLPGTAPESIADREVRQRYLRAIAENNAKAARIDAQLQAREAREKIREAALRFLREAYSQPPAAFEELEGLLSRLDVDPLAKAEIVRAARMSVPKIEMKLKENRQNEESLRRLKADGLID